MYWRARRFVRLADLTDEALFRELETGLTLVAQNARQLADAAIALSQQGHARSGRILASHATDEAGKFLLLVDAARCPRERLRNHLDRAGKHLARLLYAETAWLSPATFGELVGYINNNRASHYLDGYEGVEWVFPNQLLYWREQDLYVDYVEREDHTCAWQDPQHFDQQFGEGNALSPRHESAVELVTSIADAGLHRAPALAVVASHWRGFVPTDETDSGELERLTIETIQDVDQQGLASDVEDTTWRRIVRQWTFPLWGVDLSLREVKLLELMEERQRYPYG
jgi:AbiV family abortive infection protein